jgi:cyclic pyranopterin phosphate synthase
MRSLIDQHGRVVRDLRISVTPRCNFRCGYCDPLGMGHKDPLGTVSIRDVANVIEAAVGLGMTSVRFTGGEPLLRKELPEMVAVAKRLGVEDVAITTNATLLKRRLSELLAAGLDRVNISLDAVSPEVFRVATGGGNFKQVWEGITTLLELGLHPVKLNAVVMRGVNDSEISKLAGLTQMLPLHVRFIEYMHLNNADAEGYHRSLWLAKRSVRLSKQLTGRSSPYLPTECPGAALKVPGWQGAVGSSTPSQNRFVVPVADCA